MYSNKFKGHQRRLTSFRSVEKGAYLFLVPASFCYFGYRLYMQNVVEAEKRATELKQLETRYFDQAKDNLMKVKERMRECTEELVSK